MRKSETSEAIGGYRYKVRQLGTSDGLGVLTQIARMILPSAGAVVGGGSIQELMNSSLDGDKFAKIATQLATSLNGSDVNQIIQKLAAHTDILGPGFGDAGAPLDVHFDDHFAGRYRDLVKWAQFALKVNFANFLSGLVPGGGTEPDSQVPQKQK